jgi:O-antigen/teichoic acid export membrane protein
VTRRVSGDPFGGPAAGETLTVTRNVSTRYLAIAAEMAIGLLILPFNVSHLGRSAYGLWVLTTSVTSYFSVLDLGYSGALVKFVAQYRARREAQALNEVLSTTFYLFTVFGALTYLLALALAGHLDAVVRITPEQLRTGQIVLLVTSANVALGTAFSVFGAVTNGFQRYDLNNLAGGACSVVVAIVNVAVLSAGYGLVALVVATTSVRVLTYVVYRWNAYHVFPGLQLRPGHVRRARLRELTSFSVYMLAIDWSRKLNFSLDTLVIGMFLNTSAVAVWAVGQRLAQATQRLTNQLNEMLFPTVVHYDASAHQERLQHLLLIGTRLSLATVVPIAGSLILMAGPLVRAWVGPGFDGSVIVVQLLALTVAIRVGGATADTLLKGAGAHRLVALTWLATALVNVSLSVALVGRIGLAGVAIGTLGPVSAASVFVVFPAACRRVGLPLGQVASQALWPAAWPVLPMAAYLLATAGLLGPSLVAVAGEMAIGCGIYAGLFVIFGITRVERQFVLAKLGQATMRARLLVSASSGDA